MRMMEHYQLGEKVDCKNASVAGLLGGCEQIGGRWFVMWGVIPTHDKRLVVLEELKGASVELIARLTDMRSSGVAEIPKIEKRRTHARTRLIALSNPRSDMPLAAYTYGVEAVKELIGSLEDVRRFDAALLVSSGEIDPAELNVLQRARPRVEHRYTSELCRRCVLWAWTRTAKQVTFTDEATELALQSATELCDEFSEAIPLLDRGSARLKIARLAASLAARVFSCAEHDSLMLVVRDCHVRYVADMLRTTYSSPTSGYRDFSDTVRDQMRIGTPDVIKAAVLQTPYPTDFVNHMLGAGDVELRDVCDWCAWDREDALRLLSFLVRKRALVRVGRNYRKSPGFIALLRGMRGSAELRAAERPGYVEDKF